MYSLKTRELYDLSHTQAKELLDTCEYPWLALPKIKEYVKELIKRLEKENPGFKTRLFTAIEGSHAGNFGVFPE